MRNPYVTGPYVTGRKHYGRVDLLDRLLHGGGHAHWVIGTRRIGKTSLLRQLETIALAGDRYVPIYWDMQGCNTFASLGCYLLDAVQEQFRLLLELGFPESMANERDITVLLPALRRAMSQAGRELLLLCDETEVLISIACNETELIQRLHRELMHGPGLRVVAVSTRAINEMHEVCQTWPTSPFLTGFDMTHMLGSLDAESARALVTQTQAEDQVQAHAAVIDAICAFTNNHPYLVQLLCSRVFQVNGTLRPVEESDLVVDPLLGGFLNNDFRLLSEPEWHVVWAICEHGALTEAVLAETIGLDVAELRGHVQILQALGYLRRVDSHLAIGNSFFEAWICPGRRQAAYPPARPGATVLPAISPRQPDPAALVAQLNARRARLVELEVIRARDLLGVSPRVLAEIRQVEDEIRQLLATVDGGSA